MATLMESEYALRLQRERTTRAVVERRRSDILSLNSLAARAAEKLNKMIARGEDAQAFGIALSIAAFKDLADIYTLSVAGYILIFIDLFLMYFLFRKGWFLGTQARIYTRVGLWVAGIFFDSVPVIELMPITVIMVLLAWKNVREDAERSIGGLDESSRSCFRRLDRGRGADRFDERVHVFA